MNYTYLFAKGITGSIKVVLLDVMMLGCTGLEKFIEEYSNRCFICLETDHISQNWQKTKPCF